MEVTLKTKLASRGWHIYQKTTWPNPQKGQEVFAVKEKNQDALASDPYAIAWKRLAAGKIAAEVVGHLPREVSRFVHFFLERGGSLTGTVSSGRYVPSPIPKGGLEILIDGKFTIAIEKQRYLDRLGDLIKQNYSDYNDREVPQEEPQEKNIYKEDEIIFIASDDDEEDADIDMVTERV